jgi:hypothetical protein
MARNFDGSDDSLSVDSVAVSAYPFTLAVCFNTPENTQPRGGGRPQPGWQCNRLRPPV